jgi:transposase InsO family protein
VKYVFMRAHQGNFRVSAMSRVLQVSRSGFYAWCRRQDNPPPRQQYRKQLDEAVKKAFEARKGRSGSPRLALDLADAGHRHDRKTIAESMRRKGLRAKAARKFKPTTAAWKRLRCRRVSAIRR